MREMRLVILAIAVLFMRMNSYAQRLDIKGVH